MGCEAVSPNLFPAFINAEPLPIWRYNLIMRRSYEDVLQIAHSLPEDQRLLLANALLESLSPGEIEADGSEIAALWDDEIKQRLSEIDAGATKLIAGDRVRAEMIARP